MTLCKTNITLIDCLKAYCVLINLQSTDSMTLFNEIKDFLNMQIYFSIECHNFV